ncbi:MAG: aldehyde ferredoxin oxidoreductase family protein [Clostridia bacterium]|nr:aldehyde ferredoxin oxidoreductase family protein [Clostridia bacterium]
MDTNYGAYTGKVVNIDLTTKEITGYEFSDKERELFLGGKIMAAKIVYDNIKTKIDPLSPENMIVVTTCPMNAMGSPCSSRFNVSTISPLTGYYTSSNCGGNFGLNLKRAGYDAIIITGKAEEHTYISITDKGIEFKNADHLWGLKTGEAQERMEGKGGKFVIGPAGENLVRYACVVSEERSAGRGGVGAVFGSKNLKGLFASGLKGPAAKNKEALMEISKAWTGRLRAHPTTGVQLPALGTAGLVTPMHAKNLLATNNYRSGKYEDFEAISGETLRDDFLVKNKGCVTCPIQCGRVVKVNGKDVKGPEVETIGLFGSNILNNDLQKILDWNNEMDELGLDTISCGNTLSFAMELNEKGMWNNGLKFGKIDNIDQIIDDIAHRKGIGDELAEGSKKLSEKYGGVEFAMNVKGMELAAYEPRGAIGQGLGYAVSNRGGCHLNGGYMVVMEGLGLSINPYSTGAKAGMTALFQDLMEACSAGGNCLFTTYAFFPMILLSKPNSLITRVVNKFATGFGLPVRFILRFPTLIAINMPANMLPHPKALSAATGMKLNFGKFIRIGERGYNLERMIDVHLGVSAADDELPARLTEELQIVGNPKSKVPLDKLKKAYYKNRCWDQNGIPKKSLLKRLKIAEE